MKFRYITIEREYGSGGTKIARRLAEVTGKPCYGEEIMEAVAKKSRNGCHMSGVYHDRVWSSFKRLKLRWYFGFCG